MKFTKVYLFILEYLTFICLAAGPSVTAGGVYVLGGIICLIGFLYLMFNPLGQVLFKNNYQYRKLLFIGYPVLILLGIISNISKWFMFLLFLVLAVFMIMFHNMWKEKFSNV